MSGAARHFRQMRQMMPALKIEIVNQVIAVEAGKFHQDNFRARKWTDTGTAWKPRKDGDTSRALLVKTGRLRRTATRGRIQGDAVKFVMPIYGQVHNEGGRAGRGAGFRMPRRQFAGEARILKARFRRKAQLIITRRLNRIR